MQSAEKASSPVRSPPKLPTAAPEEAGDTSMFYEDSFSEIPEAVLDAATPKPPRQTYIELEETEEEEELDLIVAPSVERSNSTTPSPDASEHGDEEKKSELDLERELEEVASPARSVPLESLRSSPPVALGPAEQNLSGSVVRHRSHSRNLSLETPVDLAASASSRVSFNALPSQRASLAPPENPNRRTLSPIMRAGRALQMVTSDPPSPPRQGSVLRSPFRGSVRSTESPVLSARRVTKSPTPPAAPSPALASAQPLSSPSIAQQPAQQPESSWARAFAPLSQIKNLVVQGAQAFSSPKAAPAPAPTPAPAPVPVPSSVPTFAAHLADEDPFAPNPDDASRAESLRNSIFGSSRRKSLEAHEPSPSVISSAKAEVASVAGEDDMSWMADDSTPAPRIEMFGQPGSARSSVFATGGSPSGHDDDVDMGADIHEELQSESEVEPEQGEMDAPEESQDELDEEPDQLQDGDENDEELVEMEEEDDDIWAFEAARPTPRSVRTLKVAPPVSAFDKSTRGPPTVARQRHGAGASTEAEEFSMLSQLSRNETAMEREASRLASAKKADLSAFFSSPAPLPDVQPFGLFNALDAKKGENDKPARKIAQPSGLFRGLAGRSAEKRAQVPPASNPFGFSTISGPGSRGPGASPVPRISQTSTLLSAEPSRPAPRSRRAEPFGVSKRTRTAEVTPAPEAQDSNPPESFGLLGQALGPRSRSGEPAGPSQASRTSELFKASQTAKEGDGLFSQAPAAPQTFGLFMRAEPKAAETDSLPAQRRRPFQPLGRTKPAPFASQPPASLFQEQRAQTEEIRHVPQKDFQIENRRSVELFSPTKQPVRETRQNQPPRSVEHSSAPTTPEQVRFDHVPQKQNFTPRQRQFTSNSLFQPVQASGESSLFAKPAPVVRQSVEQEDDSMVMDPDESSFITPELKPLPDRAASPSKSCIRSPLKGKTPGRVVEFTSSTLSPLQQAQVRAERRASASPEKQQPVLSTVAFAQAPSVRRTSVASSTSEEDKENQTSGSELSSDRETEITQPTKVQLSTTLTSKLSAFGASFSTQPPNVPLSETTWTKAHWVRLDALLQERRTAGGMPFQVKNSALAKPPARRPSRKLLGKQVSAHGETIVLEQWHLDVVDAFRAEVGSWEEDALVKRLFALLVGEERRKKGLVPKVKNGKRVFF
ncbi:hypothetical protein GQ53DRAFT_749286 [Thozetella sp. PMI_491]|nr:hypothetical protein GQ53DRAFT_749286 [Thozetella sp. PMI_491]